jgi:hypothetical protein
MGKTTETYQVVGVTFDGRQDILSDFFKKTYRVGGNYPIMLFLDNTNKYDKNAISVNAEIDGELKSLGFISRDENIELRKKFTRIIDSKIHSMGPNYRGIIGLSIDIDFDDEELPEAEV